MYAIQPTGRGSKDDVKIWTASFADPLASLHTSSNNLTLMDLDGHSGTKFVAAHIEKDANGNPTGSKIKAWRTNCLIREIDLPGLCSAMVGFNLSASEGGYAASAAAVDDSVLIYKNLKPFYKFVLPKKPVLAEEAQFWSDLQEAAENDDNNHPLDIDGFKKRLYEVFLVTGTLTPTSHNLLGLQGDEARQFIASQKGIPLTARSVIVCLDTLFENSTDAKSPQCLVVGTENREILILNPKNFAVVAKVALPAVPVVFAVQGAFLVDYRIVVACRNGCLYTIKRGELSPVVVSLPSQAVGLERMNKMLYVGCMDTSLTCYSTKGKRLWSIRMPAAITTMGLLQYKPRNLRALIVALSNGQVRLYNDRILVNVIHFEESDPVVAVHFGNFNTYDGVFIAVTRAGELHFKMLRRTAEFTNKGINSGPPKEQTKKFPVPDKTQLYLDQAARERENAIPMHRGFQKDLFRLRLQTARNYVKALNTSLVPMVSTVSHSIVANAVVRGIGPLFKIEVEIRNSAAEPLDGLRLTATANADMYTIENPTVSCGLLVPGVAYKYNVRIKCITDAPLSEPAEIHLSKSPKPAPLITLKVDLPIMELEI
eukprot:m.88180 g.88180  ORF g.88180 m.88180 type:complete len:598 (-) comp13150_c0_seq1:62-1855(-)